MVRFIASRQRRRSSRLAPGPCTICNDGPLPAVLRGADSVTFQCEVCGTSIVMAKPRKSPDIRAATPVTTRWSQSVASA